MGGVRFAAAACGLAAAAAGLAASEVAAAGSARFPSLVGSAGQWVIRRAPGEVVHRGIEAMGQADKPLLVTAVVVVVLLAGAATGGLARRRPGVGDLLGGGVAGLGWACATSLGTGAGRAAVPAAMGAVAAAATRRLAVRVCGPSAPTLAGSRTDDRTPGEGVSASAPPAPALALGATTSRRGLLGVAAVGAGSTAAALGAAAALRRTRPRSAPSVLPAAAEGPGGVTSSLNVAGLSPLITPTAAFYRIDEALVVPTVDVATWRLRFAGMVGAPFELSYAELLAEPLVERDLTLCCVSNEVGGKLVGTARWTGVRLADLLARAGADPAATQVVGRSVDGFSAGFPVAAALDGRDALVAVGMNGEPLPPRHGHPARLVVPGVYGFVSAVKWLRQIELTTWEAVEPYWQQRGWARLAPVKVSSRVDVPRDYSRVAPGRQAIAGVAWAPGAAGIAAVAIRIDGGAWEEARLGPSIGDDAWRQWAASWDPEPGTHTIEVQAVTGSGLLQTEEQRAAFPDGASGLHTAHVRVVPGT